MNPREMHHHAAYEALAGLLESGQTALTTNLVLGELHALLARARGPVQAVDVLDRAYSDPSFVVLHADAALQRSAVDRWLRVYREVPLSICDAVSFEAMRQEGLKRAFTLDRHFEIAGFEMVPARASRVMEEVAAPAG